MKLAIMQPYIFPYLPYFQLISAVDTFVIYDDVQFMKGGWINRNNILLRGKAHLFSFGVKKQESHLLNINKRHFSQNFENEKKKFLATLEQSYKMAPFFTSVYSLIEYIMSFVNINISSFAENSIQKISEYLGLSTSFIRSSAVEKDSSLKAETKVIAINKALGSKCYINPIGGFELYSKDSFRSNEISLFFLKTRPVTYLQFNNEFVPNLSIIDVMMFNSIAEIRNLLVQYDLIVKRD